MDPKAIQDMIDAALANFGKTVVPQLMTAAVAPLGTQMTGISEALAKMSAPDKAAADKAAAERTGLTPEANSMILDLKRSNEKLVADMAKVQKDREDADKRADTSERTSVVNTALSGFTFATPEARQTAVDKVMAQLKRTDTGALVAGENLTPEAFIKDFIPTTHAYLLAPTHVSGSGVTPSSALRPGQAVDIDSIKPGMTAEARAAAVEAIKTAGQQLTR